MKTANLACPHCKHVQKVEIPQTGCLAFHTCEKCEQMISVPKESKNCCVICEHSDKKCPVAHTEQRVKNSTCDPQDLAGNWRSLLKLWGPPVLLLFITSTAANNKWWAIEISGILWIVGIVWIGSFCLKNALRCGRIHCWLIGILYPLLAIYALGITLGYIGTPWHVFWNIFWIITILTFVPEWFGKKYFTKKRKSLRSSDMNSD